MGEVELNGNTNILELKNLELDNIEFSGKSKEIILENIKSHIEIDMYPLYWTPSKEGIFHALQS